VLEECIDIRFGAMFALFICHLACFSLFSKLLLDRTGSLSPCLAAGKLEQHRNRIDPQGDGCANLRFVWQLLRGDVHQALAEPLRRVVKVLRLWA
jgi:hypothetical protein